MEGSRIQEAKSTELQRDGNAEKSNHDEVSQSAMTSVAQQTETASDPFGDLSSKDNESGSTFKEEEDENPLEGNTATKGKKKKRKKKKTDPTRSEPASTDSTTPLVPAEEADLNGDPSLRNASKLTCVEECEKNEEPLESSFTGKKRKKKKKKKKTQAVKNSELPNADDDHISERNIESNSEGLVNVADLSTDNVSTVHDKCKINTLDEVTSQTGSTVQDHEDFESMKETLEIDENNQSKNEGNEAVVLDSDGGSCSKSCESRPEEEAEGIHVLEEKDRSCSPENMGPESTAHGIDSHKALESAPFKDNELARKGGSLPEEDRICPPEKRPENESREASNSDGVKGTEAAGGHTDLVDELEASDEDNSYVKFDHEGYVPLSLSICNMWEV